MMKLLNGTMNLVSFRCSRVDECRSDELFFSLSCIAPLLMKRCLHGLERLKTDHKSHRWWYTAHCVRLAGVMFSHWLFSSSIRCFLGTLELFVHIFR